MGVVLLMRCAEALNLGVLDEDGARASISTLIYPAGSPTPLEQKTRTRCAISATDRQASG
jgi:hypothetical protein